MIGFDFEYYKPDTIDQAVNLFNDLDLSGKKVIYYGGGSEFISMARMNNVYADAVIDIKGIDECMEYKIQGDNLIIGAGISLSEIAEGNLFPLLTRAVKRIADHTMQGKITIGGNMCGTIIYREGILPLLVSDSRVVLASKNGQREELLEDVFQGKMKLNKGEMLVKLIIPKEFLNLPHSYVKRTKNEVIDYPFRSYELEELLSNKLSARQDKIQEAIDTIENKIKDSLNGSKEYKRFMLYNLIDTALKDLQEES